MEIPRCDFSAGGCRVSTEAEWEYAARGGNKSRGYKYAGSNSVGEIGWYNSNSGNKTHPVGQKKPNELGLYDMSGNVCEWCWDWYGEKYYSSSPSGDPGGPPGGSRQVFRGGSGFDSAGNLRSANRDAAHPSNRGYGLGFRAVRTAR